MKGVVLAVCCLAVCCLPAVGQKKHEAKEKPVAMTDQAFVDLAAQTDMMEAHLGQMAAGQAGTQAVKDYAQMLVTDHTHDYEALCVLAAKADLNVPKGLDAEHDKVIATFEKLKGAAFDSRYAHLMVEGHTGALKIYNKEAADAQNADLKAYATATIPTLQKHLDGAKDLLKAPSKK